MGPTKPPTWPLISSAFPLTGPLVLAPRTSTSGSTSSCTPLIGGWLLVFWCCCRLHPSLALSDAHPSAHHQTNQGRHCPRLVVPCVRAACGFVAKAPLSLSLSEIQIAIRSLIYSKETGKSICVESPLLAFFTVSCRVMKRGVSPRIADWPLFLGVPCN